MVSQTSQLAFRWRRLRWQGERSREGKLGVRERGGIRGKMLEDGEIKKGTCTCRTMRGDGEKVTWKMEARERRG